MDGTRTALGFVVLAAMGLAGCPGPGASPDTGANPDAAGDVPAGDASGGDADAMAMCGASIATPSARGDMVGVVDPETGALFVVGGDVGPTVQCRVMPEFSSEAWRYDPACDRWTQIMAPDGPSARSRAAAAFDSRRRRLVMFGGRFRESGSTGNYTLYNEVWALDLANERWEQIVAEGGPTARSNTSAVYDAMADELVIFGGSTSRSGLTFTPTSDVWALNLEARTWRRVTTTGTAPSVRLFHAAAIRDRTMLVVGGGGANAFTGPFYSDAFTLDLATGAWAELNLSGTSVGGRISHAAVAAPTGGAWLVIAGHDDGALGNRNDVLAIAPDGAVTSLAMGDTFNRPGSGFCDFPADFANVDTSAPERRSAGVVALDERRNRVIVFGGKTDCGTTNDVWALDLATNAWRPLRTSNEGVACQRSGRTDCTALCN